MNLPYLVDTHVHLDSKEYESDLDQVIQRARTAGVQALISIGAGSGVASAEAAIRLAEERDYVWATVGIHPHDASGGHSLARIAELAAHRRVVAIGESGLDFHYDFARREDQEHVFGEQIALAKQCRKPLIIHCREAAPEILAILARENSADLRGVFHCFSETAEFSDAIWELGFFVSVGGILTFKKADGVREAMKKIPLNRILLETDGPFLAPVPHRGKRCESAYLPLTARALAEAKNIRVEEVAETTTANAAALFGIALP